MRRELDTYRSSYDDLPFEEHQRMYEAIERVYPEQSWWNAADCTEFLWHFLPDEVVEIGGHDGGLAAAVLPPCPFVQQWVNFELVDCPQTCDDPRYSLWVLREWAWAVTINADALVLSHVIEHFSEKQVNALLDQLACPAVYVDAPLLESERSSWMGSETAHVLSWSFSDMDDAFARRGYRNVHAAVSNARGITSRTRWYSR